jgi:DNA-binding SARP family transcriptional activator
MDTYYLSTRYLPGNETKIVDSVYVLIQHSLNFLLHGNNAEGIPLLVQAHAQLAAETSQLATLLEAAINTCTRYNVAQEALLNASRDYVKAEAERQTQLSILADTLATQDGQNMAAPLTIIPLHQYLAHQRDEQNPIPSKGWTASTLPLPSSMAVTQSDPLPALSITCFGQFIVRRGGDLLELCRSRHGQAILRYLITQSGYRATADTLMEVLWPDEEPAIARHRLQVATSSLRGSLNQGYDCDPGGGYILFRNQLYQINPSVTLQTDVDEFLTLYQAGQRANQPEMIASYEHACRLYRGPFLVDDLYEGWSMRRREQLSQAYLTMCGVLSKHFLEADHYENAAHWAKAILDENRCDEEAHRQLMRVYAAQGHRSDALHQYHTCEQILMEELSVAPMPETLQIYQDILLGQISSTSREL